MTSSRVRSLTVNAEALVRTEGAEKPSERARLSARAALTCGRATRKTSTNCGAAPLPPAHTSVARQAAAATAAPRTRPLTLLKLLQGPEVVDQHVHLADPLEPGPLEDRPRHRAALSDQGRRAQRHRVVPAGAQERAVGAPAAGALGRGPAVEQKPVLGRGCRARGNDLAAEPDGVVEVHAFRKRLREKRAQLLDFLRRSLERFPLDLHCGLELLWRLDATSGQAFCGWRRFLRQDERNRIRILVGNNPAFEQRVDETGGR